MKVHFSHGRRNLGLYDLDAVPRSGEPVQFGEDAQEPMLVWNVGWQVEPPAVAYVVLKTEREYKRAMRERT